MRVSTILDVLLAAVLLTAFANAVEIGSSVGISIEAEQFKPLIWMCDGRVVLDDYLESGRISGGEEELVERINNYAFTGEQIQWRVLVMDKNGIEKIKDVYVAVGEQGSEDYIEANCVLDEVLSGGEYIDKSCNARIGEEVLDYVPGDNMMAYYVCTFTVEPQMHGEYWVHATVVDLDDLFSTVDEDEYWFLNPRLELKIIGANLDFGTVKPGTTAYSKTILVHNGCENNSGVLLDMFISGTDFYDPAHSGAKCPDSNVLRLENFAYYGVNGAYSTRDDGRSDVEGYVGIEYGDHFDSTFYDRNEIIQVQQQGPYYVANILAPGAEMALTFRLSLPEPCNGNFNSGSIYFWAEAI
ncbi:MAG: hypothetical protein ACP5OZ_04615 [Candidatus Woesearchaeota archaeon]